MNQHPTAARVRTRGETRYQGMIVDTTNRPHVRTPVGKPQARAGTAKAIAADYLKANKEKTRQRG
jgi:hypothetical protein